MKKSIVLAMAISIFASTIVLANTPTSTNKAISVNGNKIEATAITTSDGKTLLPVRAVATALGLNVEWNAEQKSIVIEDLPLYVTFRTGVDGYTFAKTAPMPLGQAPVIIDSVTYVPVELFSDILVCTIDNTENSIAISDNTEENTSEETTAEISTENTTSINNTNKIDNESENAKAVGKVVKIGNNEILFDDEVIGEVRLCPNDNTKLTDKNNTEIKLTDIKVDDKIEVEYGDAMTNSLPPLNNPTSIKIIK